MAVAPVAIIVPVLNRPHRVQLLMDDVAAATSTPYRLLFVVDAADPKERSALHHCGADYLVVSKDRRSYACKINDGIRATSEPLIFMAADDVHFHRNWLRAAVGKLQGRVQVVGTNDGGVNPRVAAGEHSVHTLLTREYAALGSIDDPAVVLHEGYPHEYVDDEFLGTARARGALGHAHRSIVEHLHPYTDRTLVDNTYRRGWAGRSKGKRVLDARRHLWE